MSDYSVEITGLSQWDADNLIRALQMFLPKWLITYDSIELWEPPENMKAEE